MAEGKFYRTAIRPTLLYGIECWVIKRYHAQKMSVAGIRMLRWMCGSTRRDKVRNEDIRTKIGVAPIEEKMIEKCWFSHMRRKSTNAPVQRVELINSGQVKRAKERPKKYGWR